MAKTDFTKLFPNHEILTFGNYYTNLRRGAKGITVVDLYGPNDTAKDRLMGIGAFNEELAEKIEPLDEEDCKEFVKLIKKSVKEHEANEEENYF